MGNKDIENIRLFDQAIMLIWVAEGIIGKRRTLEKNCGYPSEYGGDELLHQRIKSFLTVPTVDAQVKKLLRQIEAKDD